jgi:integrase
VSRAVANDGTIGTPKSGHGRTVDISIAAKETLQKQHARLSEAWMKRKPQTDAEGNSVPKGEMPPWVFPSEWWTVMDHSNVGKPFKRCLKVAGLPDHFSPHSLRHSFVTLLLADGVSPAYVQEQAGHASIELTVGTYGRWLRKKAPGALDRLDEVGPEAVGGALVAEATNGSLDESQVVEGAGDPRRTRTFNPEIKSLLLYQLS